MKNGEKVGFGKRQTGKRKGTKPESDKVRKKRKRKDNVLLNGL